MASTEVHDDARDSQHQLDQAIAAADVPQILRLLDDTNLDLDRKDLGHDLETPLMRMCHMRASSESLDAVLEKLERCAWNPNVQDATGRTLLMHACIADRCSLVLLCLDNGCDVSLTDVDGNSALVYAVRQGSEEIVRVFLEMEECRSLLLTQPNNFGQIPLDVAIQDGLDDIATLLASFLPSEPDPEISLVLPSATLSLSSTFAQPSPLSPRSPSSAWRQEEAQLRRTMSETGRGLELHVLLTSNKEGGGEEGEGENYHQQLSCRQNELVSKVPSRQSSTSTPHHPHYHNHLRSHHHFDAENTPPGHISHAMTSREVTSCSEVMHRIHLPATSRETTTCSEMGEKSPRRTRRKQQRLLRRETEDVPPVAAGSHPNKGSTDVAARAKPCSKEFQRCKKDYVSLPDLRDFKGKLVTSGEVTPVGSSDGTSSLQSQKSSGKRGEGEYDEHDTPTQSYLERYKDGDLSASCSLPPLQSSSADSADRRKERGGKLMHRGKANSQEEVMLRSLIV